MSILDNDSRERLRSVPEMVGQRLFRVDSAVENLLRATNTLAETPVAPTQPIFDVSEYMPGVTKTPAVQATHESDMLAEARRLRDEAFYDQKAA